MKILVVSSLYPNPAQPLHGLFVEQRVRAMQPLAELCVVAPIPYFPQASRLERYAYRRSVPATSTRAGLTVHHPRFLSVPALLKPFDGPSLGVTLARFIDRSGFEPDVIDAHTGYPDGVAAWQLAARLRVPFGVTLRGGDVNALPQSSPVRGRQMATMLTEADAVFAVSDSVRLAAVELGAVADRTVTVLNGVDPKLYGSVDRGASRERLGLPRAARIVVSAGHMVARKRFSVLIDAVAKLPEHAGAPVHLVLVGGPGAEGDVVAELRKQVTRLGVTERVHFAGAVEPSALSTYYGAADLFALASLREGRPNVVLEALACGRPVLAMRRWGLPELVPTDRYGRLLDDPTPEAFTDGIRACLDRSFDAAELRAFACSFTWDDSAGQVVERYRGILDGSAPRSKSP